MRRKLKSSSTKRGIIGLALVSALSLAAMTAAIPSAKAQSYRVIHSFQNGKDGIDPEAIRNVEFKLFQGSNRRQVLLHGHSVCSALSVPVQYPTADQIYLPVDIWPRSTIQVDAAFATNRFSSSVILHST